MSFELKYFLLMIMSLVILHTVLAEDTNPYTTTKDIQYYTTVTVQANKDPSVSEWFDTGLDVLEGEILYYSAKGDACWNSTSGCSGYFGGELKLYDNAPVKGAPIGSLLFKIGTNPPSYAGGPNAGGSGRLYLAYQDNYDSYEDNSGNFTVDLLKSNILKPINESKTAVVFGFEYNTTWINVKPEYPDIPFKSIFDFFYQPIYKILTILEPSDTRREAQEAGNKLSEMGYETEYYYNRNVTDSLELMNNADVIVIVAHGRHHKEENESNQYGGAVVFYDKKNNTILSTKNEPDMNFYSIHNTNMYKTKFVLFLGCMTSVYNEKWGSLTGSAIFNGAETVAGFDVEVSQWDVNDWTKIFFGHLAQGETVSDALYTTAMEMCGQKDCWQKHYQLGGNLTLKLV